MSELARDQVTPRHRKRNRGGLVSSEFLVKLIPVLVLFVLWELAVRLFAIPTYQLPALTAVLGKLWEWTTSGEIFLHSGLTIYRAMVGIVAGIIVGIGLGLLMAWYRPIERALDYLVAASYAIPKVAIIPLMIVWLGVGEAPKIAISFSGAVYPILLNTIAGVKGGEPILIKAARDMGATDRQLFWEVMLPGALPTIFAGLKIGAGVSFIVVVATEMLLANAGVGYLIATSAAILALAGVFAGLVVLAILGVVIFSTVDLLERLIIPWHVEVRQAARASAAASRTARGAI